ncbi:metalloendoproteinase 5-MMP-like [Argentina anserina]|uniref:metalloendoproteinase 5-MMP-like n=1 Tax=Argentina anserina TaxID=57926 RepID=UPI00217694A8|nr:metalloendoproteinase 5-MMP-like [Potentilla anserina]
MAANSYSTFTFLLVLMGALLPLLTESRQLHTAKAAIGVDELRTYLTAFGYLSKGSTTDEQQQQHLLESALKTYQRTYKLKVTGKLDSDTMELLSTPRCGVPDHNLINGTTQKGSHQALYKLGSTLWPPTMYHLPYLISQGDIPAIGYDALAQAAAQAFAIWAAVSNFTFTEVGLDKPYNLDLSFRLGEHGDGEPFDGPHGVLAHAFSPTRGLLHFDADENWSLAPKPDQIDLVYTALHEIGHLLGLAHSENPDAVMYATIKPGAHSRVLHADDIAAIHAMYS